MMRRFRGALISSLLTLPAVLISSQAHAGEARTRKGHISAIGAVKAQSKLWRIPDRLVTAQLRLQKSYFISLAADKVLASDFTLIGKHNSLEVEGQITQHLGREDHQEATLALALRSGEVGIIGGTSANFMWGNGGSYAFSAPRLEQGNGGLYGVDVPRFQYMMLFETEFSDSSAPDVHLFFRVHHRSGIYGLISSGKTGSNHLGMGLRIDLR